jgi:thiol-disulfide isomerase/thioredoxin
MVPYRRMKAGIFLGASLSAVSTWGCDEKVTPPSAPRERSQAVQATGPATVTPVAEPVAHASSAVEAPHPVLCAQQLGKTGKDAPKAPVSRAGKVALLPEKLPVGSGHWTWINLWAAWCAPCKEELPRLVSFAARLAAAGRASDLVLVSLDDDERQLDQFLAQQPDATRATYWLHEGRERDEWLLAAGVPKAPGLPVQVLVDPRGKVRCVIDGALEDQDYPQLAAIVGTP